MSQFMLREDPTFEEWWREQQFNSDEYKIMMRRCWDSAWDVGYRAGARSPNVTEVPE